jgi:hypothetical protein
MVGYERGSTARTAGSDASLRAGRLVAGRRIWALACSPFCFRGAGRHALWPWLLLRVRTAGAPARSAGVPPPGSRRSIRFAGRERERIPLLRAGPLIASFRCDTPAHCGALADERRVVAGDGDGRTKPARRKAAVGAELLQYALQSVEGPPNGSRCPPCDPVRDAGA